MSERRARRSSPLPFPFLTFPSMKTTITLTTPGADDRRESVVFCHYWQQDLPAACPLNALNPFAPTDRPKKAGAYCTDG